ncbi:unnamed protein product [Albugo candida]|nr:unnamed protein product [Albugo candida]|eukprot:CCI42220.1 unnamed protein product [Albugo candida]
MKIAAKPEEYEIAGIQTHCGSSRTRNQSVVQTFVYIRCNETISAFFCEKFGTAARHLLKGEMYCIRCRRSEMNFPINEPNANTEEDLEGECLTPEAVSSLLDIVGDAIVDIHDAFQIFSVGSDADAKLTFSGLFQALELVGRKYWRSHGRKSSDFLGAGNVHTILQNLIKSHDISVKKIPYHNVQRPFLTYIDFIAVYAKFITELNRPHFWKVRSNFDQLYK